MRLRRVALTQADTGLLLRRMMAEIPGLKVVDKASLIWPADTERPLIRTWDGEGDPPDVDVALWVENDGWRLEWEHNPEEQRIELKAFPDLVCSFDVSRIQEFSAANLGAVVANAIRQGSGSSEQEIARAIEDGRAVTCTEGCFRSWQEEGNQEEEAFLDKMFAIIEEECSDRLVWIGETSSSAPRVLKAFAWAGPDAIRWSLEEPARTLAYAFRHLDSFPPEARERAVESYGLDITEDKAFYGFVHLRAPISWPVYDLPDGRRIACDEDSDNGTLWVDCSANHVGADMAKELSEALLDRAYAAWEANPEYGEVSKFSLGGYRCVYSESETIEDGTNLTSFDWLIAAAIGGFHVSLSLRLVLTHENLADPRCGGVVEAITDAVANIRIDEEAFLAQVAAVH